MRAALDEILLLGKGLHPLLQQRVCSITNLSLAADLKLITCHFVPSVMCKQSHKEVLTALEDSKFMIRKMLTAKVNLKYSPEIRFIYDHGFDNAIRVNKALQEDLTEEIKL
jgi:ribosome-binding factor A